MFVLYHWYFPWYNPPERTMCGVPLINSKPFLYSTCTLTSLCALSYHEVSGHNHTRSCQVTIVNHYFTIQLCQLGTATNYIHQYCCKKLRVFNVASISIEQRQRKLISSATFILRLFIEPTHLAKLVTIIMWRCGWEEKNFHSKFRWKVH